MTYRQQEMITQQHLAGMSDERRVIFIRMYESKLFVIWSDEHKAWWRPDAQGYTDDREKAGVLSLSNAWNLTSHCGREKQIQYHEAEATDGTSK